MCSTNGEDVPKLGCLEHFFPIVILPIHSLSESYVVPLSPIIFSCNEYSSKHLQTLKQTYHYHRDYNLAIKICHSKSKTFSVFYQEINSCSFLCISIVKTSKNSE